MTLVPTVKTKPKALLLILEVQLFEVLWGKFSQCLTRFISNMEKFSSVTILLEPFITPSNTYRQTLY